MKNLLSLFFFSWLALPPCAALAQSEARADRASVVGWGFGDFVGDVVARLG